MFNVIFQTTIFKESWFFINTLDQFFPFVRQFYTCPSPLYILEFFRHEILLSFDSSLGGMLFTSVHFRAFYPITATHLICVFPSFAYDTHIVGLALDVLFGFL